MCESVKVQLYRRLQWTGHAWHSRHEDAMGDPPSPRPGGAPCRSTDTKLLQALWVQWHPRTPRGTGVATLRV
jgi:hypothetical protein